MNLMGSPSSFWIATTMPPLLVPSSLVTMRPVSGTALLKLARLVQGVHAGRAVEHEQDVRAATGSLLAMTRCTLCNSCMRLCFVCRRPAVSMSR
jgi:hypothetical protein